MRENRTYGSEGGEAKSLSYPISSAGTFAPLTPRCDIYLKK
jgi:hypothetical protein